MPYTYQQNVDPYFENFKLIEIDDATYTKVSDFAVELVKAKAKEPHHKIDNQKEHKRFMTGFLGEAALEKFFGIPVIDWTIGPSNFYNTADIPNYYVGIKSVEYGKFPVIFKNNFYAQMICIRSVEKPNNIYICGLATKDVLNNCQSTELIIDPRLKARGTKTGFYGFDKLITVNSLDDLASYKKR